METHYSILGVTPNATETEIKQAYRRLSYENHPDRTNNDTQKTEFYKKVNEAYEILKDETKRQQYDFESHLNLQHGTVELDVNDIMQQVFQGFSKRKPKKTKQRSPLDSFIHIFNDMEVNSMDMGNPSMDELLFMKSHLGNDHYTSNKTAEHNQCGLQQTEIPEDIQQNIEINYLQAFSGCCVPIVVLRNIQNGKNIIEEEETIYIDIPMGIDHNELIVVKEKGNVIEQQQSDLKVRVLLEANTKYKRQGIDLIIEHAISFKESVCGFSFMIEHLNGSNMKFNHTRGNVISNGTQKKIKGLGFQRGETKGDLILDFKVKMPTEFTDEQLTFIETHF